MADFDRIDRNVKKMLDQGAPDEHLQVYLDGEGITPEEFLAYRQSKAPPTSAAGAIGDIAGKVGRGIAAAPVALYNAAKGKQDPAYADTPTFESPDFTGQEQAKVVAPGDDAYHDILVKQLGPNYVRTETDANGYKVIVQRGPDGKEHKGYVNKPGLDYGDIDRGLAASAPYLLGAGVAGRVAGGLGKLATFLTQAPAAGGTSVLTDYAAQKMGSEQPIDWKRAGITATTAGFGSVFPKTTMAVGGAAIGSQSGDSIEEKIGGGLTGLFTGMALGRAGQKAVAPRPQAGAIENGKFVNPKVRLAAERAGIVDPKTGALNVSDEAAEEFAIKLSTSLNPYELASQTKTNQFGLRSTLGQRTKDPEFLTGEKLARHGKMGAEAKRDMAVFDEDQLRDIQGSAFSRRPVPQGEQPNAYKDGMGSVIAPTREVTLPPVELGKPVMAPDDVAPGVLGESVRKGLQSAKGKGKAIENKAWEGVKDIYADPNQGAFDLLTPILQKKLNGMAVDSELTPAAYKMGEALSQLAKGGAVGKGGPEILGLSGARELGQVRKIIGNYYGSAQTQTDKRASKMIYDGFNDWMDEIANKGFVAGDPAAAGAMRTARDVSKEVKGIFESGKGDKSASSRIMASILDNPDISAEGIVGKLLGGGGPQTHTQAGTVGALLRIKKGLFGEVQGQRLVADDVAKRTWNDIRLAYWSKLVTNPKGEVATPTMIGGNIDKAFKNQSSLIKVLFSPEEMKLIRQYRGAVGEIAYKDPNPSGSGAVLMQPKGPTIMSGVLKGAAKSQANRELFSKNNVLASRIWRGIANAIPDNVFGVKDMSNRPLVKKYLNPYLQRKRQMTPSGYAAGISAVLEDDARKRKP
jgi:hypothetical protein